MTDEPDLRETLVVLQHRSFDRQVPPELMADLRLDDSRILRTGSIGFTASLTRTQRATAARHPTVERLEPDPDRLAPFIGIAPDPQAPGRYVAKTADCDPHDVANAIGLDPSNVTVTGIWLTATLTTEQLRALRHDRRVDFVDFAIMDNPA
ncbi:hypothetical protein ABH935_004934 [Catenulispora sp. GAS73]|uniref:hypothetical protein n=1 Tax=Catenulispora sp. GAS73 TaxID=3156269 RepID=UPI0035121116